MTMRHKDINHIARFTCRPEPERTSIWFEVQRGWVRAGGTSGGVRETSSYMQDRQHSHGPRDITDFPFCSLHFFADSDLFHGYLSVDRAVTLSLLSFLFRFEDTEPIDIASLFVFLFSFEPQSPVRTHITTITFIFAQTHCHVDRVLRFVSFLQPLYHMQRTWNEKHNSDYLATHRLRTGMCALVYT